MDGIWNKDSRQGGCGDVFAKTADKGGYGDAFAKTADKTDAEMCS